MKFVVATILSLVSLCANSQVVLNGATLNGATVGTTNYTASAPTGWTLIGSGVIAGSSDTANVTTSAYNTVGATAIYVVVGENGGVSTTPTSSPANTWTKVVAETVSFAGQAVTIWECLSPTTSSTMTVTISSANQPSVAVMAFSGGTGTKDQSNHAFANPAPTTTIQAGSITPGSNAQLIIVGECNTAGTITSIDSSFNTPLILARSGGNAEGLAMSWFVQPTAAAINPTWTGSSSDMVAVISSHVQ